MKKLMLFLGFVAGITVVVLVNLNAKGKKDLSYVETGDMAPNFSLSDPDGKTHSLSNYKGKYVVLEWVNHGCPYVKKHYDTGNMQSIQNEVVKEDVVWISICSSAEGKQGYLLPAEWKEAIKEKEMASSVVLLDYDGKVGRLYGAKTTPHMFIINPEGKLIYQGAIDDRPTADKADVDGAKNYVLAALGQAKGGNTISQATTKSYGCSVKY